MNGMPVATGIGLFIIVYVFLLWGRIDIGRLTTRMRDLDSRIRKVEMELEEIRRILNAQR
jgi:hypothetical protein